MPDKIDSLKILCSGGLNTSENFLLLSQQNPGYAIRLVNYELSLTGGYRRINGFTAIDALAHEVTSAGAVGEGPVLGVWGYITLAGVFEIFAARKTVGSPVYRIYKFTGSAWAEQTTGITHTATGVTKLRVVLFSEADANWIVFVDGVNEATAYNGTTYYELKRSNLGGAGSPGGDALIDAPSLVTYFKGSVFLSGDAGIEQAIVSFSAPNAPLDWTAAAGAGQLIMGFPVIQVRPHRDENFIFGESRISKAIPDLAAGFIIQTVTTNIGCIAADSVQEIAGDLIFLSPDGIRPIAGTDKIADTDLGLLSQTIQNTINTAITTYDLSMLNGLVIRGKTQFRYFLSDGSSEVPEAYGLIGAVRTYDSNRQWEFGELLGIRVSSCWSGYDADGDERIFHGDFDGSVYEQEIGSTMNGENILSIYTTPYLDFGDPMVRKLMRKLHLFIRSEGSVTLDFSVRYDWDRTTVQNPAGYQVSSTGSTVLYDSGVEYDDGSEYGDAGQPVFSQNIQGSGYSVQCSIVTDGIYAPYTVQGLIYEFSIKGRQLSE